MHHEFQQITGPSVFDQQIFRRGLLQRNNFPLHFLSRTKTPLKWMAFAHSLWPQLAVLLPALVLRPLNRQAADEGRQKGLTQQVEKHMKRLNTSIRPDKVLFDLFTFVLFLGVADFLRFFFFFFFPPNIRIKKLKRKRMFDSLSLLYWTTEHLKSTVGHWSLIEGMDTKRNNNRILQQHLQEHMFLLRLVCLLQK